MRTMIAAGAVGALLAGGMAVQPAAQESLERTMEGFLDLSTATMMISRRQVMTPVRVPRVGTVNPGETARVEFYLEAGVRYGVVCVCLCDDLEFEMHDSAGRVVGVERTKHHNDIALWLTPAISGRVAFDAILECARGDQCAWGMQVFRVSS